jgi:diguanylate cyclase (GGDEF)-like protein
MTPGLGPGLPGWGQFLAQLFAAETRSQMAAVALAEAKRAFGCLDGVVLWSRATESSTPRTWHGYPGPPRAEDLALLSRTEGDPPTGQRTRRLARPLMPSDSELQLYLVADWPPQGPRFETLWADFTTVAQVRVAKALELEQQHRTAQTLQESARLQSALYSIADLASGGLDMPDMLRQIHAVVGTLMYAENFLIVLYDADRDTLRFIYFADSKDSVLPSASVETPADQMSNSLTLAMMRSGQPAMGPSLLLRERFGLQKVAAYGPDSADWLGVPMLGERGVCGGVVVQSYDRPNSYRAEDRALLAYVAQHILTALQRKQAQEELELRVEERTAELRIEVQERERGESLQAALYAIAELSSSELDMSDMLRRIHDVVRELMYAENFFIVLRNLERQSLRFIYFADVKDPGLVDPADEIPESAMASSMTMALMRQGKPIRGEGRDLARKLGVAGAEVVGTPAVDWLGVPMAQDGQVRGAVVVQSYDASVPRYTEEDSTLLAYVAQHILTALARKQTQVELERRVLERTRDLADAVGRLEEEIVRRERVEQKLTYEALHDSLTGLPNRSYLVEALERSLSRLRTHPDAAFAVLFLDLDRFKVINDSVGHLVGDELLKLAGIRLTSCVPSHGVVARLGGDEFAILLEHGVDTQVACQVAQRIIDAIGEPMSIAGKELFSSASVGIVMSDMRYNSTDELLRDADFAMYRAKAAGRQRFEVFDERLHSETLRALDTEGDLRRAVIRSEFEPHFQPIVRLADGNTVGYEALIRWRHPERGLLLPEEFLSLAEESGIVEQIDWQMFDQTCTHVLALVEDGQYVTFNLSPRHFRSSDLPARFLALLGSHGIAPRLARIEVTEGTLLENPEQVCSMIAELREGGILVALDDFGTGYSSLSYLNRFPLHALKIDRSFVASLRPGGTAASTAIVRAVLALAKTLGLEVVAEGVETQEQRQCLLDLGCEFGQGFLFGAAQPVRPS